MKTMNDRIKDWREGKKAVCFFMDAKEHNQFKHKLLDTHQTMSHFLLEAVKSFLKNS